MSTNLQMALYNDIVPKGTSGVHVSDTYTGMSRTNVAEFQPELNLDGNIKKYVVSKKPNIVIVDSLLLAEEYFNNNARTTGHDIKLNVIVDDSFVGEDAGELIRSSTQDWRRTEYLFRGFEHLVGARVNFESSTRDILYDQLKSEKGKPITEQRLLLQLVRKHNKKSENKYNPEDIVCVASGHMDIDNNPRGQIIFGDKFMDAVYFQFNEVFLTTRGETEYKSGMNKEVYQKIRNNSRESVQFHHIKEGIDPSFERNLELWKKHDYGIPVLVDLTPGEKTKEGLRNVIAVYRQPMGGNRMLMNIQF